MNDDKLKRANQLKQDIKNLTETLESWEKVKYEPDPVAPQWDRLSVPYLGLTPTILKRVKEDCIQNLTVMLNESKQEYEKL